MWFLAVTATIVIVLIPIMSALAPAYYGTNRPVLEQELPPLDFGLDELEPYMDTETVRIHYLGHHAKYKENLNNVIKDWRKSDPKQTSRISILDMLRNISAIPRKWRKDIRNFGGGFVNHNFYWAILSPNKKGEERLPRGALAEEINSKWGAFIDFKRTFTRLANEVFGSGYLWLCRNHTSVDHRYSKGRDLIIVETANQDSPLSQQLEPLLVIDVWEHAYYLKHKMLRSQYISDWWKLVDWNNVNKLDDWWRGVDIVEKDEL